MYSKTLCDTMVKRTPGRVQTEGSPFRGCPTHLRKVAQSVPLSREALQPKGTAVLQVRRHMQSIPRTKTGTQAENAAGLALAWW
jgi:hypothetical protein